MSPAGDRRSDMGREKEGQENRVMKKRLRFFFSMKFAIGILIVLVLACTVGSVIPQGNSLAWYSQNYSERIAGAVMLFGLNDVFHSGWFIVLTVILCANLLGCNLVHAPELIRRWKTGFDGQKRVDAEEAMLLRENLPVSQEEETPSRENETAGISRDPQKVFASLGFRKVQERKTAGGRDALYAVKNKIGIWGAWFCHLGMLIVIIGFALGQALKTETSVYGVPGQTKPVGDTSYALTIDDFDIALRDDETVEQYTAILTMTDTTTGESQTGEASVNHPVTLFGRKLYQNSTGWAAMLEISKGEEVIQENLLCVGEYARVEDLPDLVVTLAGFYPDYVQTGDGKPGTASSKLNNPAFLYRLYYKEQVLGMNVLPADEIITVEDYTMRFKDPRSYTMIQIKRDPFTPIAAAGGLVILCALILAFYVRTAELLALRKEDGSWVFAGYSRKGGAEFQESVKAAIQEAGEALTGS